MGCPARSLIRCAKRVSRGVALQLGAIPDFSRIFPLALWISAHPALAISGFPGCRALVREVDGTATVPMSFD